MIIIIGATHGIGFWTARRLLEEGRTVFGVSSNPNDTRGPELEAKYPGYRHHVLDVSDEESVERLFAGIDSEVEAVIDCAGIGFAPRTSSQLCAQEAKRVLDVNLLGAAYILKHGQRVMSSDGALIVCGSIAAQEAGTGADAIYSASKAGLKPLLRDASLEEANAGRTFIYLNLGYIETRMTACDDKRVWLRKTPYGQAGRPEEVAELVSDTLKNRKAGYYELERIGGGYPKHEPRKKEKTRSAGVLLSVTSLPNLYGCGSFGSESYRLIDELYASGMTHVLLLPLNQVGFLNSPYSALSSTAGCINLISPELLYNDELLSVGERDSLRCFRRDVTDYANLCVNRPIMIRRAYRHFKRRGEFERFEAFCRENREWLDDFSVFMSAKYLYGGRQWQLWPDEGLRAHDQNAIERFAREHKDETGAWQFSQFVFYEQFENFRSYANQNGIKIIGDLPYYVCADSSDVWAHRELFSVDPVSGEILEFGGIPNRGARDTNWGVPTHNWEAQRQDGFRWWRMRLRFLARIMDGLRLDHALGMLRYYAIPADGSTPSWKDGPDVPDGEFSRMIANETRDIDVIAEDLGQIVPGLRERLDELGFCGTRICQYSYSTHYYAHSNHLPITMKENAMLLTGTHDNMPLKEFLRSKTDSELAYMMYMLNEYDRDALHWSLIRSAYNSPARYCTFPLQDLLGLGLESCLVNREDFGRSWLWRLKDYRKLHALNERLRSLAILSGRLPSTEQESSQALEYILGEARA